MERKETFNEVAREYDKYRPSYPKPLFIDIVNYASLRTSDRILEIGCGTGQATSGFVELGYERITCVERGNELANLARAKFKDKPGVTVIDSEFEAWRSDGASFDLAVSGTAFHFIQPQSFGYRKVFDLLRAGGATAFFWTVHVPAFNDVWNAIRECYNRHAPQLDDSNAPSVEAVIGERADLTLKDGLFHKLEVKTYRWDDTYTASDYVSLLNTNSRHRLVPEKRRSRLFEEIGETIEKHGGSVVKPQAIVLFLANKNRY
ncbi:class I SAM-dependent methyltransferase [Paenibacillus flagellatus]|uniref:Class I SAM-dependent methyltransferase n=1 Tax=Paenibacillus flagellatus TaxID=2211139 RepID=A0A2V5K2M6_9BACL|nr:class I SAM-dependent methyltransferase [Paenibacillus flagellatus]PYI53421.1 class I SAM-dependent methyltransferase [Paenibacillus flagellatus]